MPVSMKEIALATGVTPATVSLALRNHPRISEATRTRIQEAALRLGYQPNPLISALMAQRSGRRANSYKATLVYLCLGKKKSDAIRGINAEYWSGALQRAQQLGFKMDTVFGNKEDWDPSRMEQVLHTRNISGLILGPVHSSVRDGFPLQLSWDRFSLITVGYSVTTPIIHRAAANINHVVCLALNRLREKGNRRIGMMQWTRSNERVENQYTGSYLGWQQIVPRAERVPLLYFRGMCTKAAFAKWIDNARPDAIVCTNSELLMEWLKELNIFIPQDMGFACLNWTPKCGSISGVHQNGAIIGAEAVNMLARQLYHNEIGPPEAALTVLVKGSWIEGVTAPGR